MKKIFQLCFRFLLFTPLNAQAQMFASEVYSEPSSPPDIDNEIKAAQQMVDSEQASFKLFLARAPLDNNIKKEIQKFLSADIDKIQSNLAHLATAKAAKRAKGIRSIGYFLKEINTRLEDPEFNEFKIPEIIKKYKQTLTALMNSEPFEKQFKGVGWRTSQMLANAFWQFDENKIMADISAYKRVVKTPDYIFSFLESKTGFNYADSLIVFVAKNYPQQLIAYLQRNNNAVTEMIRKNDNRFVQGLITVSSNNMASELAPFAEQIVNNELTIDEILDKRKKVTEYYQLLVDKIMSNETKKENGNDPQFQKALRNSLSDKALSFYIKKINDLHNSPDGVRFQSVQDLRPQDIYYIIVSADEEMYTSSYLGLYKRLMAFFGKQSADSLFALVHDDKFRKFMRVAATYNTLPDFLHRMSSDKSRNLVHLFISDIDDDDADEAVADATDIADAFISLSKDEELNGYVKEELSNGLRNARRNNLYQGTRLYTILEQVYGLVNNQQAEGDLSENYKSIPVSALKDRNGNIAELVLFYGDDDGKNSYKSFMGLFRDNSKWKVESNESWTTISSLQGKSLKIYANLPLDNDDEKDISAQQALVDYLKQQNIEPSILIHRGHSYHLANTLKYLQPYTKIAVLGSCGGYKNMKKIMDINPNVHIVASKQVGSMAVNDPLLNHLNEYVLTDKNIDWVGFWSEMNDTFKKESAASKLFEEYVPPYKNVSGFVVKLYNTNADRDIVSY
jgi:hypothetical protein